MYRSPGARAIFRATRAVRRVGLARGEDLGYDLAACGCAET